MNDINQVRVVPQEFGFQERCDFFVSAVAYIGASFWNPGKHVLGPLNFCGGPAYVSFLMALPTS